MHEIEVSRDVLVLGSGVGGTQISLSLPETGLKVNMLESNPKIVFSELEQDVKQNKDINLITSGKLIAMEGQVGNFEAVILKDNKKIKLKTGAVVVAEEPDHRFIEDDFGLSLSDNIITQSRLLQILNPDGKRKEDILNISGKYPETICFLLGNASQEGKINTSLCLENSLILKRNLGSEVYVFSEDLKLREME